MTIQELNVQASFAVTTLTEAKTAIESALIMAQFVADITSPNKPITAALQQLPGAADALSQNFGPDFFAALTTAETKLDEIGTDILH